MKKRFISLAAGIAAAVSVAGITSANALDPPMIGDFNQDWTVNIADMICLQRYLMGKTTLNMNFGITPYDINFDGSIDVFDFITLKQEILTPENKIESTFTRAADSIDPNMIYNKMPFAREAVIRSTEKLENYLSPCYVMTVDEECITYETVSEEVYNSYMERYTDDFFANNVLLLNYLGRTCEYTYESIQYEDSDLVIKYYNSTPHGLTWNQPLAPLIGEVTVPKSLFTDGSVIWQEIDAPFTPVVKTDITNAVNKSALEESLKEPSVSVIESSDGLNNYLAGKFKSGVERSLKNKYNDEFFEKNVLILDLYAQHYRDNCITDVSCIKNEYGSIELVYDHTYPIHDAVIDTRGFILTQVAIPREQYLYEDVVRKKTWENSVDASYTEYDLGILSEYNETEITKVYNKAGEWINSAEEMDAYIAECLTEEGLELINIPTGSIDWDKNSVYMWLDDAIIGSKHKLMSVNKQVLNDQLVLNMTSKSPLSCMGGSFIHMITTDKNYYGYDVITRNFDMNDGMPSVDGDMLILDFESKNYYVPVMINQYAFGDENTADIYRLRMGGGPVQYYGYDFIGTIELPDNCSPFAQNFDPTYIQNEDGSITCYSDTYTITYSETEEDTILTVNYTISDSGETAEQTFTF